MHKYIILTMCVALCACNNGDGGNSGYVNVNTKPGNISNGNHVVTTPDIPVEPEYKPTFNLSGTKYYWYTPATSQKYTTWGIGTWDKKTNIFHLDSMISENGDYSKLCDKDEGCDFQYKNGEYYLAVNIKEPDTSEDKENTNEPNAPEITYDTVKCTDKDGCVLHVDKDIWATEYCRDKNGCVYDNSTFDLSEMQNDNGLYSLEEEIESDTKYITIIASGTENLNVPLHYSDFGYFKAMDEIPEHGKMTAIDALIAGDPSKEVDMQTLAEIQEVSGVHNYTGKAFVEISSGFIGNINEPLTDAHKGKDTSTGFSATGNAKLTFDANNGVPNEHLLMNFTDAGWYNVYMNGDGSDLRFFGNTNTDKRFEFETTPTQASDIEIKYYGDNTTQAASEVVGTAAIQAVKMQDGLNRDIVFSFGAIKN